jgi:hypothetical protein
MGRRGVTRDEPATGRRRHQISAKGLALGVTRDGVTAHMGTSRLTKRRTSSQAVEPALSAARCLLLSDLDYHGQVRSGIAGGVGKEDDYWVDTRRHVGDDELHGEGA